MNDEELRAFLDSATVQDSDEATSQNTEAAHPESAPAAAPRRAVPSFDELMNMPSPDAAPAPEPSAPAPTVSAQSAPEVSPTQPEAPTPAAPTAPVSATAVPASTTGASETAAAPQRNEWSQAYAQDNEQLVPLILPGFSSAPKPARDLPPVFQAEPAAPAEPETQHVDPAPTQPFDVLSGNQTAPFAATPVAATSGLAVAATTTAATTPLAATVPTPAVSTSSASAAASPVPNSAQVEDNPFAALAPEFAAADSADDEYERIAVTGGVPRGRKALPWLIVGGGAVIAIIASIFVINGIRGADTPAPTEKPAVTAEPSPDETPPAPAPKPSEEPAPAPEPSAAPVVNPGSTWSLPIEQWGITVEVSEKLGGSTPYTLFDGNSRMMFDSLPVASGLSDACAAARAENVWGLLKKEDGTLEVVRPEPRCTAPSDAAVYDTIWGVLDYMAKSAKPA